MKGAIKSWKGPEYHSRIDENLNEFIVEVSNELADKSSAFQELKVKLDAYKAAGLSYLGTLNDVVNDRDIRNKYLQLTIGEDKFVIMNMQLGLAILGLRFVTGEDLSVCLHMDGLDNSDERESLFLPKICTEKNAVGKWKFRDQLLAQYQEWAVTFKLCFDGNGFEGRFNLDLIRKALQQRESAEEVVKERHIMLKGGEHGEHYEAMEPVFCFPQMGQCDSSDLKADHLNSFNLCKSSSKRLFSHKSYSTFSKTITTLPNFILFTKYFASLYQVNELAKYIMTSQDIQHTLMSINFLGFLLYLSMLNLFLSFRWLL